MNDMKRVCECRRKRRAMIRINELKLKISHTEADMLLAIAKHLHLTKEQIIEYHIIKKSIDARKKQDIHYTYAVNVVVNAEKEVLKKVKNLQIQLKQKNEYRIPIPGEGRILERPIIVGSGPAGLFSAYLMAKLGYAPIIVERGAPMEERILHVEEFWKTGILRTDSNVPFGEGGAGTFSDGKLNTLVKDPFGRSRFVLETFVSFGAPSDILYWNKPHIGTDYLQVMIPRMRKQIEEWGGEFRFHTKLTDIQVTDGRVTAVQLNRNEILQTDILVLAIGHSARDTFEMLLQRKIPMERKAFAMGLRVEHPQGLIGERQYGMYCKDLPAASYKLTHQASNKRGVYSFCMCPGGYVVNASSEEGCMTVNGMSNHKRDGENANSAIIVTVEPDDFLDEVPDTILAGVEYQRKWEKLSYQVGDGRIPIQLFGDYKQRRKSTSLGAITPNTKGNYEFADLSHILPEAVRTAFLEGMESFDHKIPGFSREEVILSGIETRTSSPVRILRENSLMSQVKGLYPCGEGAGYAGGIMSAAMDGMKVSEAIIGNYKGGAKCRTEGTF